MEKADAQQLADLKFYWKLIIGTRNPFKSATVHSDN